MKKIFKYLLAPSAALMLLIGCGSNEATTDEASNSDDKLQVVSSFTIIQDLAREIGGDDVSIHNLVPTGTDPHEYEPLPLDMKKATDADILFYNGLNLEGGEDGWFFKMINSVNQDMDNLYSLTERVEPMYLSGEDGKKDQINPHAFINPAVGIKMAEDMRDAFIEKDPENKGNYEERATAYLERLKEVEKEYRERINDIPEEKRILVTSERAFQYMADEYGLKEGFIWAIDTEENGSPEQIKSLIAFVKDNNVPVLFIESNVDTRPMETVSKETGVPFSEKPIYSDEIGKPGEEVDTYMKYLNYNINLIHDELKEH
ncbi:Manganese-binding lipoprotein MntA [Jeotgalibaca dankookensis]|uniref:Manganese-binding lipoprotein MntA n=1 Tax=Jeotgalibaca dankookensis TaxID=708126 RepID=A0A1S6IPM4_9LACT|nr:zinc ABC transporter substrate-binding protein [Jeotgalibaca dankookensis]AQS53507.1 Manganese-binding lipoprotein MntA [Jeotgalibaca dankookensis]